MWSFNALKKLNEWTSTSVASRCGKHLLIRMRGQPMGAGISPVKCGISVSETERRGWENTAAAREKGFIEDGEKMVELINGSRIADDTTVGSKLFCGDCVVQFLQECVYVAPLAIEVEEVGNPIGVADLTLTVRVDEDDAEWLDVCKHDKNTEYALGAAAREKAWRPNTTSLCTGPQRMVASLWTLCRAK